VTDASQIPDTGLELALAPLDAGEVKGPGEDQAQLSTALGKRNLIRLGAPRSSDYVAELLEQGELPKDIEEWVRQGFDFRKVRLSLTLLPDQGCVFLAVELTVELLSSPRAGETSRLARPLTYSVEPTEVLHRIQLHEVSRQGLEGSGEVGAGPAKLVAKYTRENTIERDGVRFVRERFGHGVNFTELGWRFQAGGSSPLEGDYADLAFVARVPHHAGLSGRFHIVAEVGVETGIDRWLTRIFGPRSEAEPLDEVYSLDPDPITQ
jgi:hypothetical protein